MSEPETTIRVRDTDLDGSRPLVFVDGDGVLTSYDGKTDWSKINGTNPECLARLQAFVEEVNAVVVISSTWRRHTSFMGMVDALGPWSKKAMPRRVVDWKTPILGKRGDEIEAYLKEYTEVLWLLGLIQEKTDRPAYVVFDDEQSDLYPDQPLARTRQHVGLQDVDIAKARELLAEQGWTPAPAVAA